MLEYCDCSYEYFLFYDFSILFDSCLEAMLIQDPSSLTALIALLEEKWKQFS